MPVFGPAALLGFDLLPRIRNRHDLIFYRPQETTRYAHIDSLFGDETVDWERTRDLGKITLYRTGPSSATHENQGPPGDIRICWSAASLDRVSA